MALSPMMQHYLEVKQQNSDCILFYRLGDFYEMFFEDAQTVSKELELTLTGKDCGLEERAPMCGVPHHSANVYINKLIAKGYKVAICEQLTDPKQSRGLVERGVVRIITPGTVIEEEMLDEKANNYIASVYSADNQYCMALCDLSTGHFFISKFTGKNGFSQLVSNLQKFNPHELITLSGSFLDLHLELPVSKSRVEAEEDFPARLREQFSEAEIKRVQMTKEEQTCAGILLSYLHNTQKAKLEHINTLEELVAEEYMLIDSNARTHLELLCNLRDGKKHDSLLGLLDQTGTAMGGRLLRQWLSLPLQDPEQINRRLDAVETLKDLPIVSGKLAELLGGIYDIERIISKLTYGSLNARDCIALKKSLGVLPQVLGLLTELNSDYFHEIENELDCMEDICELLEQTIAEEPPLSVNEGDIIKPSFNPEIGKLYDLCNNSKQYLMSLEQQEKEATGIKNLKLGYNKVFGYYLEVTKSMYDLVPYRYVRKQTLANCERYITEELKQLESEIFEATTKRTKLEYAIFQEVRSTLTKQITRFQRTASYIAQLDVLNSLATVAGDYQYIRPNIGGEGIVIDQGRHPIVERSGRGEFIANDTLLDGGENNFAIITGPNMAGKSTYMRQVALITILAHIGSFVPAASADIAITDKVFTRIGASDALSEGKSTFMVEMSELANILNNATENSLVILDEIGRGTSTIDGLSIALATVMYITQNLHSKTMFATHYHQLSTLQGRIDGVVNYQVAVSEDGEDVVFLHAIKKGGTDKSFGIYVAKLAGLPFGLIDTAKKVMEDLTLEEEQIENVDTNYQPRQEDAYKGRYLRLKDKLNNININNITPIEALTILQRLTEEE